MAKRWYMIFALLAALAHKAVAQVVVDRPVQFTGAADSLRQITNLGTPTDSADAVSAQVFRSGELTFATAMGKDTLAVTTAPSITRYAAGMRLNVKVSESNTGPVYITANGLPLVPLVQADLSPVPADYLVAGEIISVIFNGSSFQVISKDRSKCPSGFVEPNSNYCIEINERALSSYENAAQTCMSINARLCTWGEWYFACQKTGLGITNMTNNWEWLDDTANHSNTVVQTGDLTCTAQRSITIPSTLTFKYRCCFSK